MYLSIKMEQKIFIISLIAFFLIPFTFAEDFGYTYLEGDLDIQSAINYSTVNVNNSDFLDGYDSTDFVTYVNAIKSVDLNDMNLSNIRQFWSNTATASGNRAFAWGFNAVASGYSSLAFGYLTDATGEQSIAIGNSAQSLSTNTIAIGSDAYSDGVDSVALGDTSYSNGLSSTAIGFYSNASEDYGVAIGYAKTNYDWSYAFGKNVTTNNYQSMALGLNQECNQNNALCIGANNTGINTDNPTETLDVYGTSIIHSDLAIDNSHTTPQSAIMSYGSRFFTNVSDNAPYSPSVATLNVGGEVSNSDTIYFYDGIYVETIKNPSGTISSLAGIYIEDQDEGTDNWGIVSNAGDIYHQGNVWLGFNNIGGYFDETEHPTDKLHVVGNASITENLNVTDTGTFGDINVGEDADTDGGHINIGDSTPLFDYQLNIADENGGARGISIVEYKTGVASPLMVMYKARGNDKDNPVTANDGDFMYSNFGGSYNGTDWTLLSVVGGQITSIGGVHYGNILWGTGAGVTSVTSHEKMRLDYLGDLHLDSGTTRNTFYIVDGATAGAGLQIQKSDTPLWAINKISGNDDLNFYNYVTSKRSMRIYSADDSVEFANSINVTNNGTFGDSVGIGTTTPTHELNVIGDVNITGNLTVEKNIWVGGCITYNATGTPVTLGDCV